MLSSDEVWLESQETALVPLASEAVAQAMVRPSRPGTVEEWPDSWRIVADAEETSRILEHLRSAFGKEPAIADIRALESVDLLAFERRLRAFAEHRHDWPARTGPQAILHSGGLASAAILGALQIAGQGYDLAVFSDEDQALAWAGGHSLAGDYAELRAGLLGQPQVVRRVRSVLDEAERPPATEELARRVGSSVRSLQRHLASEGTSLRELRARHAVEQIERLLTGTDLDLSAIAARLGLSSAGRVVSLFRAARGMTPGAFRASQDPGPQD